MPVITLPFAPLVPATNSESYVGELCRKDFLSFRETLFRGYATLSLNEMKRNEGGLGGNS